MDTVIKKKKEKKKNIKKKKIRKFCIAWASQWEQIGNIYVTVPLKSVRMALNLRPSIQDFQRGALKSRSTAPFLWGSCAAEESDSAAPCGGSWWPDPEDTGLYGPPKTPQTCCHCPPPLPPPPSPLLSGLSRFPDLTRHLQHPAPVALKRDETKVHFWTKRFAVGTSGSYKSFMTQQLQPQCD